MRPISTMNVIPFIDVMLVLLAVVLTTATFVAQGRSRSRCRMPHRPINCRSHNRSRDHRVRRRRGVLRRQTVDDDALAQRIAQLDTHTTLLLRASMPARRFGTSCA